MSELRLVYHNIGGYRNFDKIERIPQGVLEDLDAQRYDMFCGGETMIHAGNQSAFNLPQCCKHYGVVHHCYKDWGFWDGGRQSGGLFATLSQNHAGRYKIANSACSCIMWITMVDVNLKIAVVYIPPETSSVWKEWAHADPLLTLMQGVIEAEAAGYAVLIVGDMNARIGVECDLPPLEQQELHPAEPMWPITESDTVIDSITRARASMDQGAYSVNDRGRELLEMLRRSGLVVLNGRAPGDEAGHFTYQADKKGASTIDLVCVSASLYPKVQRMYVHPIHGDKQHAYVEVAVLLDHARVARGIPDKMGRKVKVCRPDLTNKALVKLVEEQLAAYEPEFARMGEQLQTGRADPTTALQRIVEVIKACVCKAEKQCRVDPKENIGSRGKDGKPEAPWFDQECHKFLRRFKTAWDAWRKHKQCQRAEGRVEFIGMVGREARKARTEYRRCLRSKRFEYLEAQQRAMLQVYFSSQQSDFWKAFNKGSRPACSLDNVEECTEHFKALYGNPVCDTDAPLGTWSPSVGQNALSDDDVKQLNAPLTMKELTQNIISAKCGKAADLDGMTMEAVKLLVHSNSISMLECIRVLLDNCSVEVPKQIGLNKLLPIPKAVNSGTNLNLHRGIAISNIFGKVGDRYMNRRFSALCEEKGLRSATQCGFRPQHGTLDALFTLRHLVDKVKSKGSQHALLSILVDCVKAFDKVNRQLMLRRCKEIGVTGKFLTALESLYDKISMVVCLQGRTGEPFETYQGTKQGSELSPLLFGLFVEQMHYLIQEKVPGAGPVIDGMHVPDIMYADDVILLAIDDEHELQQLIQVLDLFCFLFGMEVNMQKTKVMIFRSGEKLPDHLTNVVFTYRGETLQAVESEKYLGVVVHAWKDMVYSAEQRGGAASRSLHSMMHRCRQTGVCQPAFMCELFDTLVRPVISYGAHIWGPSVFNSFLQDPLSSKNALEKIHADFLRLLAGMGRSVHKEALYKEFGRYPLMVQWLVLAARWWNTVAEKDQGALAFKALRDDVLLMLDGKSCWSRQFLDAMSTIKVIANSAWHPRKVTLSAQALVDDLRFDEKKVKECAENWFDRAWNVCCVDPVNADPESADGDEVFRSTFMHWVGFHHGNPAKHLYRCIPQQLRRELLKLKLGCHELNIHKMRMQGVGREKRWCPFCVGHVPRQRGRGEVEDLRHFMLYCGSYANIRAKFSSLFNYARSHGKDDAHTMRLLFDHDDQLELACCVREMMEHRRDLLRAGEDAHVTAYQWGGEALIAQLWLEGCSMDTEGEKWGRDTCDSPCTSYSLDMFDSDSEVLEKDSECTEGGGEEDEEQEWIMVDQNEQQTGQSVAHGEGSGYVMIGNVCLPVHLY